MPASRRPLEQMLMYQCVAVCIHDGDQWIPVRGSKEYVSCVVEYAAVAPHNLFLVATATAIGHC